MKKTIMIVDDSIVTRNEIEQLLKGTNFDVIYQCRSGEEALEAFEREKPDIVTMENMLDMYLFETNSLLEQLDELLIEAEKAGDFTVDDVNEIFRIMERNKGIDGNYDGSVSISLIPASDFPAGTDVTTLKTDITDYLKDGTLKGLVDVLNKSGELDSPATDYRGIGYYEKSFDAFVQTFAEIFNKLNTNTSPYTGATSVPTTGVAKELTSTGSEKAEYSLSFLNSTGNFLNKEKITINGQTYTFGDGTGDTIAIGSSLEGSLVNLTARLNADAADMTVNGGVTAGSWAYQASTGKLTWTSNDPLAAGTEITSSSIKAADGSAFSLTYKADPLNVKNFDLFKTSDGSKIFTANNIKISDDWMNNTIHIISSHGFILRTTFKNETHDTG